MKDMQFCKQSGGFRRRARIATLCFACVGVGLLNLPEAGYSAAVMVKQAINLTGSDVTVDSYNSSDPVDSVNGQWAASVSGDGGDVICINGISNLVSVGNANIYGRAYVASGSGVALGANGFIGTHAWAAAGNTGTEAGYLVPNTNFPFRNITLPDYSGFLGPVIPGGTAVTTNFEFPSGIPYPVTNYYDSVISGNYFTTNALRNTIVTSPSTLVLPNGYAIDNLTIVPGASLTVYVGGSNSLSMAGNDIVNQAGLPSAFVVYCTSNVTTLALSGNAQFSGVLVAPYADVKLAGGGNNNMDFSGAIMANSLSTYGHWNFHFDEALLQEGIVPPSPPFGAILLAPTMSASGQFQFYVSGMANSNYVVESSTDLTDWLPIFTNSAPFTFTDTNAAPPAQNFYRAVYYQ